MKLRISLILIIACLLTTELLAQSYYARRADRTLTLFYGSGIDRVFEFDPSYRFPVRPNLSLGLEKRHGSQLHTSIELNHHHLQVKRNEFQLRNRMLGLSLKSKFVLIPINGNYARRPLLNPYVTTGFSIQRHKPQLYLEGDWSAVRNISGLEGKANNTDFNWVYGIGVLLKANKYIDIFFDLSIHNSLSDKLYFDSNELDPASTNDSVFGSKSFASFSIGLSMHIPDNFFSLLSGFGLKTNKATLQPTDYKLSERYQDYLLQLSSKSQIPSVRQEFTRTRYVVVNNQLDLPVDIALRNYASYHQIKKAEVIFKQDTVETRESFDRNIEGTSFSGNRVSPPVTIPIKYFESHEASVEVHSTIEDLNRNVEYFNSNTRDIELNYIGRLFETKKLNRSTLQRLTQNRFASTLEYIRENRYDIGEFNMALLYHLNDDQFNASSKLNQLLKDKPYEWRYHYLQAITGLKSQDYDLKQVREHLSTAYALNDSLYQKRKIDINLNAWRALNAVDYQYAMDRFEEKIFEREARTIRQKIAKTLLMESADIPGAIEFYTESYRLTKDPGFLMYMAYGYANLGEYGQAIAQLYEMNSYPLTEELIEEAERLEQSIQNLTNQEKTDIPRQVEQLMKLDLGDYHAIIISNDDQDEYQQPNYRKAIQLEQILRLKYGFVSAKVLHNQSIAEVNREMNKRIGAANKLSNLLIVYIGPGGINDMTKTSYWQFNGAEFLSPNRPLSGFINHTSLEDNLNDLSLKFKHIVILSNVEINTSAPIPSYMQADADNIVGMYSNRCRLVVYPRLSSIKFHDRLIKALGANQAKALSLRGLLEQMGANDFEYKMFRQQEDQVDTKVIGDFIFVNGSF